MSSEIQKEVETILRMGMAKHVGDWLVCANSSGRAQTVHLFAHRYSKSSRLFVEARVSVCERSERTHKVVGTVDLREHDSAALHEWSEHLCYQCSVLFLERIAQLGE